MTDHIRLTRLAVFARHGLHSEEEKLGQRFYVTLDASLDLGPAGRSDDMTKSVDYGAMADVAVAIATGRRFKLIEALAETIASALLDRFPAIEAITVSVDKPSAPVTHVLDGVAVEITRRRGDD